MSRTPEQLSDEGLTKIKLEPAWRIRPMPYFETYLNYPPTGFKFFGPQGIGNRFFAMLAQHDLSYVIQAALSRVAPLPLIKSLVDSVKSSSRDFALTYSIDHLVLRREPWVLEMSFELPFILCGSERQLILFKTLVSRILASPYCRAVVFQLRTNREAFEQMFGDAFAQKMYTVPRATVPKPPIDRSNHSQLTLLFVNSGNINTIESFYMKGGHDVVETFLRLRKHYKDLGLTIRSRLPPTYISKLTGMKGVQIFDEVLSQRKMESLWSSADIFVHPHYGNLSNSIIDAMSYGLPVVATDSWATSEIVDESTTGYLVKNPLSAAYTQGPIFHLANKEYIMKVRRSSQEFVVNQLVERLSVLIEDAKLRHEMGMRAYQETLSGRFSISRRNSALRPILAGAIEGRRT